MSLWVDKYRPRTLAELDHHPALAKRLDALASSADFPHMLFYGPSGAGKKTRILCTLRALFGPGVEKVKIDQRVFVTPSRRKLDVNVVQSNYHIELTPSDVGQYDRVVIQDILKEIAQTQQVDLNARQRFKVVIINEADALSRDAQAALRRTMEKYMGNLRLILCAESTSQIIGPIRSRCLLMRVGAPNEDEMTTVLSRIAKREKFALPPHVARQLAEESDGNLRKAILVFEALKMQSPDLNAETLETAKPDWEVFAHRLADSIVERQDAERLLAVRAKLYELLAHCIPPVVVLKTVTDRLVVRVDDQIKPDVIRWAAFYELRMRQGNKKIFHLEAFVAKCMSLFKRFTLGALEEM